MNDFIKKWESLSNPPSWAIKKISGGRLAGKSDINPQWRYKVMTEIFGACGEGWKFEIKDNNVVDCGDGQKMVFVRVATSIKLNDKWTEPVEAIGGDFLIQKEKNGLHYNDEAYKMATTDALGNCLKYYGVASIIYEGNPPATKYERAQHDEEVPRIEKISQDQYKTLCSLCDKARPELIERIMLHYKINTLRDLPKDQYHRIEKALQDSGNEAANAA